VSSAEKMYRKKKGPITANRGIMGIARVAGDRKKVSQKKIQRLREIAERTLKEDPTIEIETEFERLHCALVRIAEFGESHPGFGFSCARMARDALAFRDFEQWAKLAAKARNKWMKENPY
jgi:hypothetical protein